MVGIPLFQDLQLTSLIIIVPSIANLRSVNVVLTTPITLCILSISCFRNMFSGWRCPYFFNLSFTFKQNSNRNKFTNCCVRDVKQQVSNDIIKKTHSNAIAYVTNYFIGQLNLQVRVNFMLYHIWNWIRILIWSDTHYICYQNCYLN